MWRHGEKGDCGEPMMKARVPDSGRSDLGALLLWMKIVQWWQLEISSSRVESEFDRVRYMRDRASRVQLRI